MIATIESQFNKSPVHFNTSPAILLDPERKSVRVEEFEEKLSELIIGRERAVRSMRSLYQLFLAGMNQPDRLGPGIKTINPLGIERPMLSLVDNGLNRILGIRPASKHCKFSIRCL